VDEVAAEAKFGELQAGQSAHFRDLVAAGADYGDIIVSGVEGILIDDIDRQANNILGARLGVELGGGGGVRCRIG
jgi:hypothetical protein